jgi:hypothetical protein
VDTGSGIGSSSSGQVQSTVKAHRIVNPCQEATVVYHGRLQEKHALEAKTVSVALRGETTEAAQLPALSAGKEKEADAQNTPTQKKNRKCINAVAAATATTRAQARDMAMVMVHHNTTAKATMHNLLTRRMQDHHRCTVILNISRTMPITMVHSNRMYLNIILNLA